jgi:hypothetical protein
MEVVPRYIELHYRHCNVNSVVCTVTEIVNFILIRDLNNSLLLEDMTADVQNKNAINKSNVLTDERQKLENRCVVAYLSN